MMAIVSMPTIAHPYTYYWKLRISQHVSEHLCHLVSINEVVIQEMGQLPRLCETLPFFKNTNICFSAVYSLESQYSCVFKSSSVWDCTLLHIFIRVDDVHLLSSAEQYHHHFWTKANVRSKPWSRLMIESASFCKWIPTYIDNDSIAIGVGDNYHILRRQRF